MDNSKIVYRKNAKLSNYNQQQLSTTMVFFTFMVKNIQNFDRL
jgi:hypothetical protein